MKFFANRKEWFGPMAGPTLVLWWIPAGEEPTVEEATARLALLGEKGPSPDAFTFAKRFSAPPPPPESSSGQG